MNETISRWKSYKFTKNMALLNQEVQRTFNKNLLGIRAKAIGKAQLHKSQRSFILIRLRLKKRMAIVLEWIESMREQKLYLLERILQDRCSASLLINKNLHKIKSISQTSMLILCLTWLPRRAKTDIERWNKRNGGEMMLIKLVPQKFLVVTLIFILSSVWICCLLTKR